MIATIKLLETFGGDGVKNLAALRKAAGMKQIDLASALGVSQSTVGMWETDASYPTADKLPAIAKLLGCTIDALFVEQSA